MPRLPKGVQSLRQKAIALLTSNPYLTSWEIASELEVSAAIVSGVLYKDTKREHGTIKRRVAQLNTSVQRSRNNRGWEYYVERP